MRGSGALLEAERLWRPCARKECGEVEVEFEICSEGRTTGQAD